MKGGTKDRTDIPKYSEEHEEVHDARGCESDIIVPEKALHPPPGPPPLSPGSPTGDVVEVDPPGVRCPPFGYRLVPI